MQLLVIEIYFLSHSAPFRHVPFPVFNPSLLHLNLVTFQEPKLDIDTAVLDAWKRGQFTNADALLSAAIPASKDSHHVLASRALVRACSGQWDAALVDAKEVHITPLSHILMLTPF